MHREQDLPTRCRAYLDAGPPKHILSVLPDFVSHSLTDIIIGQGAQSIPLDAELLEIGPMVLLESDFQAITDVAVRQYLELGAKLVREVIEASR